jgi:tetratricopeptide (TPR) repeat protein
MAWAANDPVDARALLERAHAAFEACGDGRAAARVSERLANVDFHEGHLQQAITRLEKALAVVEVGEPDADVAAIAAELGRFLALSGERARASAVVEQALSVAAVLDLPETLVGALNTKHFLLSSQGRLYEGRLLMEGAVALAIAHDLHGSLGRAYNNLGDLLERCDSFAEAVDVCERRVEHDRRRGDRTGEVIGLAAPVSSLVLLGRWDEALTRAAEVEERATIVWTQSLLLAAVSIFAERGDVAAARGLLSRLAAVGASEDAQSVAGYRIAEASVLRAEGRLSEALGASESVLSDMSAHLGPETLLSKLALTEALEAAAALGDTEATNRLLGALDALPPGRVTPLLRAQRARFRGRSGVDDSDAEFRLAERHFRELGTTFYLAVTQLEHAEWLAGAGRVGDAAPLLAEAHAELERLGAVPWLERASRLAADVPEPEVAQA